MSITKIFADFQQYIDEDQHSREEIRNIVRELEQAAREILILLQTIHQQNGLNNISSMCDEAIQMFRTVQEKFGRLGVLVPRGQYYRFHDHWRFVMQRLSFLASLVTYLSSEKLASREEVAFNLGVEVKREDGFHIDLDDYLMGLLHMASELSRLTVNSVTSGDYARPLRIARFLGELDAGFRLLNLKNDSLRKRFDGLKYDIKKVEEVVYDLSIRNLAVFGEDPKQPGAKKDAPSTSTSKSIVAPDTLVTGALTSKSTVAPDPPVTEVSTDAEPTESSDEPCEQIDLLEAAVKQTVGDELKTIGEAMDTHQDENNMQTGSPRHVTSAPSGQESEISIPEQPVVTPDMPGGGQQDLLTEGKTIQPTTHGMSGLPASHIQAPQRQPTPPGPTFSAEYGQPVVSMPQDQSHFPPSQEQTVFSAAHMQPGITQEQASFTAQHGQPSFQAMQGQPLIPMQHGQTVPPSFPSTQHGQQAIPAAQEQPAFSAPYGQTVFAGTQEQGYPSSQGQLSYPVTHEQQGYQVPQLQPGYQVQPGYTAAPTQPLVPQVHPGFPAADGHSVYPDPQGQSSYPGLQGQDAHYPPPPP